MITRTGSKGFLAAHYDWLVLGIGLVVLGVGVVFYVSSLGEDPDEAAAEAVARIDRMKPTETGVASLDLSEFQSTISSIRKPSLLAEIDGRSESFLASERRVLCKCGKAISGDVVAVPACPYCGEKQKVEKKPVLDTDGDGLPDEWEKKYGLNVNDASDANADLDGDGFTNLEEYVAKTDPKDPKDHPDYLDSLKIVLPLKETSMPFTFRKATKIPAGWRCEFYDPSRKDDYGRKGKVLTAIVGEEIVDKDLDPKKALKSGFVLKGYTAKSEKRAIPGSELKKTVDVSEAVVERKSDGKVITLVIQEGKNVKLAPIDVQARLSYERGSMKTFDVVSGDEIVLSGSKYKVKEIKAAGKGAKVTLEAMLSGKRRTLEAP